MADRRFRIALLTVCVLAVFVGPTCNAAATSGATNPVDGPDGFRTVPTTRDAGATNDTGLGPGPRIVELYPNPPTEENVGEYLVLEVPRDVRLDNVTITDGHTEATLPNRSSIGGNGTPPDRFAATLDPEDTETLTDDPVVELEGHLRLAADGDDLEVRVDGEPVDAVSYERAPEGELWTRDDSSTAGQDGGSTAAESIDATTGEWWPQNATRLPVTTADVDEGTAFVLPDAPAVPLEVIEEAEDRLLVAGYTFTSEAVADELLAAAERGVDVDVLLEADPVGGTPANAEPVLESLVAGGVDVRAIGGDGSRYDYHHPKYAVSDDSVLVTSENWKNAGIGGKSSRGWGFVLEDRTVADELATVFEADFDGWDTESSTSFLDDAAFTEASDASEEFPVEHDPERVDLESVELLLAPDNADERLRELVASAEEELLVQQPRIAADVSLLEEAIEAARRGVEVRILLDSSWYVEDENEALKADLERAAADEDLPLEIRLVDPGGRFEKIHTKGVVVDRETAVVGSANWNENALRENREVLLALHGEAVATYYAEVFESDWGGASRPTWSVPLGLLAVAVVSLALTAFAGRRYVTVAGGDRADAVAAPGVGEPGRSRVPSRTRVADRIRSAIPGAGIRASEDANRTDAEPDVGSEDERG
ncbi:phosphatidylserine/phosphatidylglycerophosphate/cardiolipin synthase family protein [Natrialbaceae archaeon GCM10025810]|uniref:phospholipase D-like domain-containing protein n=1 Tax=Halovalidus salilacus TaxID=3075124 RepID=UPI003622BCFA